MQPILIIAVVAIGAVTMSTGFLMPEIGWFNLQGVSVNERDFSAPLDHANVDIDISKKLVTTFDPSNPNTPKNVYVNLINQCSFHTPDPGGLGPGSTVICKLTDFKDRVVAEGRADFPNGLDKSERTVISVTQTAFPNSNEIQNINDIKIIVLGGNPTDQLCAMLAFDTCVDFDGIASPGRGISGLTQDAFLTAPLVSWVALGPLGGNEGVHFYDFDADGIYDLSMDALTMDYPFQSCPTAGLNGLFDAPGGINAPLVDCVIVDVSSMLSDQAAAAADLEALFDQAGNGIDAQLAFFDTDADGLYDDAEDIFLDGNLDGILN